MRDQILEISPKWDHFHAGGPHFGFRDAPPSSCCQAPQGPCSCTPPAPLQLLLEAFWHLWLLVELSQGQPPRRPPHAQYLILSCANNRFIWGFSSSQFWSSSGKISLSRDIICAPALFQSKSKGLGLISSFLRQKINKHNQRTCRGEETSDQKIEAAY